MQTIVGDRTADWVDFYRQLFGFSVLPDGKFFGVLPKGTLLESPCHQFYLQLIEPPGRPRSSSGTSAWCASASARPTCRGGARTARRGIVFVDRDPVQPSDKGALTQIYLGGVTFELVDESSRRTEGPAEWTSTTSAWTRSRWRAARAKLAAIRAAGSRQVMLSARDISPAIPGGRRRSRRSGPAACGSPASRCCATSRAVGPSARLQGRRSQGDARMCHALGARVLLVCSSTSKHATGDRDHLVRDLRKLAMLAVPLGIRVAYEALSWGRHVNEYPQAWEIVQRPTAATSASRSTRSTCWRCVTALDALEYVVADKIFLVQLADFMWQEIRSPEERINTARHFRVFPGEGVHSEEVAQLVRKLDAMGYRGDYSFEVFNDDYGLCSRPATRP